MRPKNSGKLFLIFSSVCFLAGVIIIGLYHKNISSGTVNNPNIQYLPNVRKLHDTWGKRIDEVGAEKAYLELKKEYSDKSIEVGHRAAHVFGLLLFEKLGLNGIDICDDSLFFGCFHSYFANIVASKGISIIATLNQKCLEKYGPVNNICQHGIGHGLLSYLGTNKLNDALNDCLPIQHNPIFGCTGGVFMEYNFGEMESLNTAVSKEKVLDPNNPYDPCLSVDDKFKTSCFYMQTSWWYNQLHGDTVKLGNLCSGIKGKSFQHVCFMGIGNNAAQSSSFNITETVAACGKLTDKEAELYCRAGASWRFYTYFNDAVQAKKLCEVTNDKDTTFCFQQAMASREGNIN